MRLLVPPAHYNQFSPVGLRAALRSLPAECTRGGDPAAGRAAITSQLNRLAHGRPALQISTSARWTLNAFAGGYARELNRQGQLMAEPSINTYAVLMTGLESFAAVMRAVGSDEDEERHYAFTGDGRKYLTSRPAPGTLDHGRR
jgi:hypothetical protein